MLTDILKQTPIGIIPMAVSVLLMPMMGGALLMVVLLHMEIEVKGVRPSPEILEFPNEVY